jgi:hypothetical protein
MLACAALICFRRAVKFVRLVYRSTSLVDAGRLDAAEDRLMGLSRSTRFFITEANRLLTQLPYSEEWLVANAHAATAATTTADGATCPVQVSLNSAPGFIPLDFDIFSWDFSFLYPDLASFENIIETTTM